MNIVLSEVQNIESSWILHDLDLVMINCSLDKSRVYLAKHSSLDAGIIDIKNSIIRELKAMSGYKVIIHSSQIHINASFSFAEIDSENSKLILTQIAFDPKGILKARSSLLQIKNVSMSSAHIYLIQSSLQSSMLQANVGNSSIWVEESNATFQCTLISNVVLKKNSILEIDNSISSSEIEAEDSKLLFTKAVFSKESFLRVNNCYVEISSSISPREIKLIHSSLAALNTSMRNSKIWAEESNITLQNSMLLNSQIIDLDFQSCNFLTIENSTVHIKDAFLPNSKCALCTEGVKNITISKFNIFVRNK